MNKILYHLSFNKDLGKHDGKRVLLYPRLPDGYRHNDRNNRHLSPLYPEPEIHRICFSETLTGCFLAIYPNISKLFEIKKYPYIDICVYSPVGHNLKTIPPEQLTKLHYVHDAHVTREHWVCDPIYVNKKGRIRIYNTNDIPNMYYYPFDDKKYPRRYIGPEKIYYEVI